MSPLEKEKKKVKRLTVFVAIQSVQWMSENGVEFIERCM